MYIVWVCWGKRKRCGKRLAKSGRINKTRLSAPLEILNLSCVRRKGEAWFRFLIMVEKLEGLMISSKKTYLVDIPMVGKKFTWYKLNGVVKSRIDRILVSREWLETYPNSKQCVKQISLWSLCASAKKYDCGLGAKTVQKPGCLAKRWQVLRFCS